MSIFDVDYYLQNNKDLKKHVINLSESEKKLWLINHFNIAGKSEKRVHRFVSFMSIDPLYKKEKIFRTIVSDMGDLEYGAYDLCKNLRTHFEKENNYDYSKEKSEIDKLILKWNQKYT